MPGFAMTRAVIMTCPHGGTVSAAPSPPRVLINGAPAATVSDVWTVAGCGFNTPCVTVSWLNVSTRVSVGGQFAIAQSPPSGPGNGVCAPTPAPPVVLTLQPRVVVS
ncbi:hypothetical protein M6D93_17740 [Jatrophihabitans telluris]|uniref:DUF4280 domain-containing protein n=1 Tax=Jatrophihabitans telluris TaxID=2038343 RepID=A0ABY4QX62_9ACTN|nr:hypothetical protein [Jatrophihabitans telluris]UQX88115.1 hypothetical protein M6D93_17740 [Jatrophihabitans telluris]